MTMKLAAFVSLLALMPFQVLAGSCLGKNLEVWVLSGQDLEGDGPLNDPEPYVKLSIGGQTRKTTEIHSSSNPSWLEEFRFFNIPSNTMKIEIWDADSGLRGDDDDLGSCTESLISGGSRNIQCRGKNSGSVKLMYKCS